jgi:chaperone modulatory protein CbpM
MTMSTKTVSVQACWLSLEEFSGACSVSPEWVRERVREGLLQPHTSPDEPLGFDAPTLRRAVRMRGLERDFDAVPELAALVADLEAEVKKLRMQLARHVPQARWLDDDAQ